MNKIKIKVITADILSRLREEGLLKKVATDYPSNWDFPIAIYRTSDKPHAVDFKKNELQTEWTITIEIYGSQSLTDISSRIIDEFSRIGFQGSSEDANTADKKRVVCKFTAIVDNVTKHVYQK